MADGTVTRSGKEAHATPEEIAKARITLNKARYALLDDALYRMRALLVAQKKLARHTDDSDGVDVGVAIDMMNVQLLELLDVAMSVADSEMNGCDFVNLYARAHPEPEAEEPLEAMAADDVLQAAKVNVQALGYENALE